MLPLMRYPASLFGSSWNTSLPHSVSSWWDPLLILLSIVTAYVILVPLPLTDTQCAIGISLSVLAVMSIKELAQRNNTHNRNVETGLPRDVIVLRGSHRVLTLTTWLGTMTGFFLMLFAWILLPEYHRAYYAPLTSLLPLAVWMVPLITLFGISISSKHRATEQPAYHLGLYVIHIVQNIFRFPRSLLYCTPEWSKARTALLSWLIRGFFLPINFCELVYALQKIRGHEFDFLNASFLQSESLILSVLYFLIIASVAPGYMVSARSIHTDTRDIDHTWFGWVVTFVCYAPFYPLLSSRYLSYRATADTALSQPWAMHLQSFPEILMLYGSAIIACEVIHLWAEAQFGLRSSNISNRGIITTGPLRFVKHPVFLSKSIGWFLIWIPFLAGTTVIQSIQLTLLFAGSCVIYYMRCHAEERVLARDPEYVRYALWMDTHSLLAPLGRVFPPLTFAWKYDHWTKTGQLDNISETT